MAFGGIGASARRLCLARGGDGRRRRAERGRAAIGGPTRPATPPHPPRSPEPGYLDGVGVHIVDLEQLTRQHLERHQVWIYLVAILAGLALGSAAPGVSAPAGALLWPLLDLLLYTTFTQVPLTHLPEALCDRRFIGAVLVGNFILVPLAVCGLITLAPDDPAMRFGVLLVLLVPCTDWYITFTHLGGGDARRAIAATPVNLLVQLVLLPVYLWLFMSDAFLGLLAADRIALAFVTLVALPLLAAWLTERRAERSRTARQFASDLTWLPVPLLASVVFLIAAAQVQSVLGAGPALSQLLGIFVAFLIVAAVIGVALARMLSLPAASARALIFSLGTRNSFVVLPLSLALEPQWQPAAVVIVFQSLVELFGMVAYLRVVPSLFAPAAGSPPVRPLKPSPALAAKREPAGDSAAFSRSQANGSERLRNGGGDGPHIQPSPP